MSKLVSLIVPAWDVAHLLPRCLDSLLAQTYRPLEILVVDDGSTDPSLQVMRAYEAEHPEIRVISQEHRGLGPARNAALDLASGEYVFFVDADDWAEPDYVTDLVGIAERTGADVVVCGFWFHKWGLKAPFPFLPHAKLLTGVQAAERSLVLTRMPAFAWNKVYRRSLFHADEPFPSILYEDLATTTRVLSRAETVAITRRAYYHYCLRKDSITGQFGVKNVFSFAAAIDILRHFLISNGYWEPWRPNYRRLLRQARNMMATQVLLQPNRIPLRARLPLLLRYTRRLRALAEPPTESGIGSDRTGVELAPNSIT